MDFARDLIEKTIRNDPSENSTWQIAVRNILLISGNGYFWNDEGNVEHISDLKEWEAENERQILLALPRKLANALLPGVKERVIKNKKILRNIKEELDSPESLTGEVFVESNSLLAQAPANISEDWSSVIHELTKDAELIWDEA